MSLYLQRLNARQREAVTAGDGPLLVLAGAGSGKTSTMSYRIAHAIAEKGRRSNTILGLSFTRKAALELKDRVRKLIKQVAGKQAAQGLTITTFHSLCVQILRREAHRLGFETGFSIIDQNDQVDIVRKILRHIKIDDRKFDPSQILFQMSQAKNRFLSPEQSVEYFMNSSKLPTDLSIAIQSVYPRYLEALKVQNSLDFDDLIFYAVKLFEEHPDVARYYSQKFSLILVDEYQDTNPAQFKLLRGLTSTHKNLTVVGDDDQSIYSWRGADHSLILQFQNQFADAKVITLDQNYRSTTAILDAANQVIQKNKHRHPKQLWSNKGEGQPIELILVEDDRAESEWVAEEILRRVSTESSRYDDFAILYRSNPQARIFEEALRLRQIPYKIVGTMSFMDRKEIKDLISVWRAILNPKDDPAVRRILNWPARGISPTVVEKTQTLAVANSCSFFEALKILSTTSQFETLRPKARDGVLNLIGAIDRESALLMATPATPEALSLWARDLLGRWGIKQALDEEAEDAIALQKKTENVEELCNSLGMIQIEADELAEDSHADAVLRIYLQRVLLDALEEEERDQEQKEKEQKNQVTLLTLHGSKGLEYEMVFLVGCEEGLLPHQRTLDAVQDLSEERRLCYVGMTRAKNHLVMTRTKNRIRYGKRVPRIPSRFLDEIPKELVILQDESLSPEIASKELEEAHEAKVKDFLAGIRASLQKN